VVLIVCNSAVEEYKESLKKDLSLESIETFLTAEIRKNGMKRTVSPMRQR
jgi:hypothetical protein